MIRWSILASLFCCAVGVRSGMAASQIASDHSVSDEDSLVELGPTLSPLQYVRFCQRYRTECEPTVIVNGPRRTGSNDLELVHRLNRQVNNAIVPARKSYDGKTNPSWTIAPKSGDCNDYAVTKQHELLRRGFPSGMARLAEVRTIGGEGHLVLVVATIKGDLVLDNLTDEIRPWAETSYRWLKIQSKNDPRLWVELKSPIVVPAAIRDIFRKIADESHR